MNIERRELIKLAGLTAAAWTTARNAPAQRPVPKSEYDYVDWSWEKWRSITKATRPQVTGEHTGKAELIDLLDSNGNKIRSVAEWNKRRDAIRSLLIAFLGNFPRSRPALDVRLVDEKIRDGIQYRKVTFQTEPGERVPAYILFPANARGKLPAVMCPHQTTQAGKNEPAGLAGNPELYTALELCRRGFVTMTYDAVCFGERHDPASGHYGDAIPFYRKHPRWSLLGKMVWDFQRAVDVLETLDLVDAYRIGSIGHSHGGYTTLFAMAFDERIKGGVSNCGFETFRIDGNTWRWSHATALVPKLGFYRENRRLNMDLYRAVPDSAVIDIPFDTHEMLALIAPRPLLLSASDEDFVFPNGGWSTRRAVARVRPVYQLYDRETDLESSYFSGGHNFPSSASSSAYEFLSRHLKKSPQVTGGTA
ncbi:MAG: acetylxylan esterase [Acidobacteriota bacterium]